MRKSILITALLALAATAIPVSATTVEVSMNSRTPSMTMADINGNPVNVGTADGYKFTFDTPAGTYIITGYDSEGKSHGTIQVEVPDQTDKAYTIGISTVEVGVQNTDADGNEWKYGEDFTIEAVSLYNDYSDHYYPITMGAGSTENRRSILTVGATLTVKYIPSEAHKQEGYINVEKSQFILGNSYILPKIPVGTELKIIIPGDAYAELGVKEAHFKDFKVYEPLKEVVEDGIKTITYMLDKDTYNIRAWRQGGITHALYTDLKANTPQTIEITEDDFNSYNPKQINHDPKSNSLYESGNIFLNINERGHLTLKSGQKFDLHAMRIWEITNSTTANYFFEPDFHFTISDINGNPSTDVISIETDSPTSAWRTLKAIGKGTAIVTVTYDALSATSNGLEKEFLGGRYWGAIWPENTGVFVVTVDEEESTVVSNMTLNEALNLKADGSPSSKQAEAMIDAEHDVLYYLDNLAGYSYTFKPEGVASVSISYPTIGEKEASYSGFTADGVTANADGSYTILLKYGRNIVRLTDATGNSVYQIINAKPCHYELSNVSRVGSTEYHPGDKVKIQLSGLFHPASKLAGIYNQSCYIQYNGIPNGTDLILGAGQYTFAGSDGAQQITMVIPDDYSTTQESELCISDGVLKVNGYGDPYGNHRNIARNQGRQANMAAAVQTAYFGALPAISFPVSSSLNFNIVLKCNVEDVNITVTYEGETLTPNADGTYPGKYGSYTVTALKRGYKSFEAKFDIDTERGDTDYILDINLENAGSGWDGHSMDEPAVVEDVYQIGTSYELAWFANYINSGNTEIINAVLTDDIDLNNMEWTPIGKSAYKGVFDGQGHTITGLYINNIKTTYQGLFHTVTGGTIKRLVVEGYVKGSTYVAGIVAYLNTKSIMEECVNRVTVEGTGLYTGGLAGFNRNNSVIRNCYNEGNITGRQMVCSVTPRFYSAMTVENVFNMGKITADSNFGPCLTDIAEDDTNKKNMFSLEDVDNGWLDGTHAENDGTEIVSASRMASGEIAYRLGEAFGQTIGEDAHPVLHGAKVFKVTYTVVTEADGVETLDESTDDNAAGNDDESTDALYTNGSLPETLDGYKAQWFKDAALSIPATSVEEDATLYVKLGDKSAINGLDADADSTDARWYNLQGVEIAAPAKGTRGIFIRVVNGRGTKVVL